MIITAYDLGRLRDIATQIGKRFGWPEEIQQARDRFDGAVPNAWDTRNGLTHFDPHRRNDRMINMGAIMELLPDGGVKYLVDPRWNHHDAALALAATLRQWLRCRVEAAIAADPPRPVDEQIRNRSAAV